MKKIPSLFIAAILLFFTANTVFAKDNPKAASYKTHEAAASDKSAPVVYFIRDITPEALVKVYKATGYKIKGKTGVKVSTGESENSNYLRPALIKKCRIASQCFSSFYFVKTRTIQFCEFAVRQTR